MSPADMTNAMLFLTSFSESTRSFAEMLFEHGCKIIAVVKSALAGYIGDRAIAAAQQLSRLFKPYGSQIITEPETGHLLEPARKICP